MKKDKLNDNLLFSCCCARVGPTWSTVCGCYDGGYRCEQKCVEDALQEESLFYPIGIVCHSQLSPTMNSLTLYYRTSTTTLPTCTLKPIFGLLVRSKAMFHIKLFA